MKAEDMTIRIRAIDEVTPVLKEMRSEIRNLPISRREAWVHYWLPGLLSGVLVGMLIMLAALGYLW